MSQHEEDIDVLIAAHLSGETSPAEAERLSAWRNASAQNEARYQLSAKAFGVLSASEFAPDVERAWQNMENRLGSEKTKVLPLFSGGRLWKSAAAVAGLALGAYLTYSLVSSPEEKLQLSTLKETKEQVLPDGSKVFVNRNSTLQYASAKNGVREVILEGEAFFEVAHNENKPFTVKAGSVIIRDIGTAFNVRSARGADTTLVFVESGEVELSADGHNTLRLTGGESGGYSKTNNHFFRIPSVTAVNAISYRTKVFTFREERLANILKQINDVYQSQVRVHDPALGQCRLSVSFNNEPLDVIVDVISETLELDQIRQGDTLTLTGNGCRP